MKKDKPKTNYMMECRRETVGVPYKRPKDFWSSVDNACEEFFRNRGMGRMSENTDWARPNRKEAKNG